MKTGDTFKIQERKYHVVNIFIDNDIEIVTAKYWRKHKQRWEYESAPRYIVEIRITS